MKDDFITIDYVQLKMDPTIEFLILHDYDILPILPEELISYFDGEAPSGDTTTLEMVLHSRWLLIHELVEINELKKDGFSISFELLISNPIDVFRAHLKATEMELYFATRANDFEWVEKRLKDVQNWSKDSSLSKDFVSQCADILDKFSINKK